MDLHGLSSPKDGWELTFSIVQTDSLHPALRGSFAAEWSVG